MSTFSALFRLCANRHVATSSTRESAACRTTSPRSRKDAPCVDVRVFERRDSAGCVRAAQMAVKAQTQAWEVIQKRFQENLADLSNLLRPPK